MIMVMLTRNTGDYLQEKYNAATRVRSTRSGRLKVHRRNLRIPTVIKSMMIMIMMMTMIDLMIRGWQLVVTCMKSRVARAPRGLHPRLPLTAQWVNSKVHNVRTAHIMCKMYTICFHLWDNSKEHNAHTASTMSTMYTMHAQCSQCAFTFCLMAK